jgi:hypothetical protein
LERLLRGSGDVREHAVEREVTRHGAGEYVRGDAHTNNWKSVKL